MARRRHPFDPVLAVVFALASAGLLALGGAAGDWQAAVLASVVALPFVMLTGLYLVRAWRGRPYGPGVRKAGDRPAEF